MSCPHPFSNTTTGERPAGRFAPSPTSALHIGNLRTALAAWLLARCSDRRFVVRVEDLDQQRVAAAGGIADQQLRDLEALGLDWDGPVMRQSERLDIYSDALAQLPTYPCFCTRREIAAAAQAPNGVQSWRPYPGTCRTLSHSDRQRRARVRPAAIRLASEVSGWQVTDQARGTCLGQVDDVVLRRNDGVYAYNLAVVVDDGVQGVDQVVRARDLWPCSVFPRCATPIAAWCMLQTANGCPNRRTPEGWPNWRPAGWSFLGCGPRCVSPWGFRQWMIHMSYSPILT